MSTRTLSAASLHAKDRRTSVNGPIPTLQHRHFALIASVIHDLPDTHDRAGIAAAFAAKLKFSNPNFDRERFLRAALPQPGPAALRTYTLIGTYADNGQRWAEIVHAADPEAAERKAPATVAVAAVIAGRAEVVA